MHEKRKHKNAALMEEAHAAPNAGKGSSHSHCLPHPELLAPENAPLPTYVHRVSADTWHLFVEEISLDPPTPVWNKCLRALDPLEPGAVQDFRNVAGFATFKRYQLGNWNDDDGDAPPEPTTPTKPKPRTPREVKPSDSSLHKWRLKHNAYIVALMRCYSMGDADMDNCPGCRASSGKPLLYRCSDCFGNSMYCQSCVVEKHHENPLHRVWKWSGQFFIKTPLKNLGLRVQVGHDFHAPCSTPEHGNAGFVVLHINGVHKVAVDFCGCELARQAGPLEIQLLCTSWFPVTHERPQTCTTLTVLEKLHQDMLQAKLTMYDCYGVLKKLTDNTGVKPPDRYHEGCAQAYVRSGVGRTTAGELVLRCLACPRPGVNLPDGWEKATPEERFLYTLFLALDACFRLKRCLVSSKLKDPDLGSGWAYMLETTEYRKYLRTVTDQKEMNTYSGAALDHANMKFSCGYSTTGVGMGVCAQHEFVQPKGISDLQKGKRFANMDYILPSILKHLDPNLFKMILYNIVCIWKKHLFDRLKKVPANVRIHILLALFKFVIPKMHIHSHMLICRLLFSLNLILGSAQVDGEGIKRSWSSIGGVATSTVDMGHGSRHDLLDCQWSYWNWRKLIGIIEILCWRMDYAKEEAPEQVAAFETFSQEQGARVAEWKEAVLAFELDGEKKRTPELSEVAVRLQFTEEEVWEAARGVPSLHNVSPSRFIAVGLDLEDEQRRVCVQAELKKAMTTGMQIDIKSMWMKLNHDVHALQALSEVALPAKTLVEDVPIMLPSALTPAQHACCIQGLENIEALLRDTQCRVALVHLQNQLHIKSRLLTYKKNHARHQGANTRSRTIVMHNETKIRLHSEKYQTAWEAMCRLYDRDESRVGWWVMKRENIQCMADAEDLVKKAKKRKEQQEKQGKRLQEHCNDSLLPAEEDDKMKDEDEDDARGPENCCLISWIWQGVGVDSDESMLEALRVEWLKAFAQTRHWDKEERLLMEEYLRIGLSFEHEARCWDEWAAAVPIGVIP
ncbi:hypothetical protein B0H17DRAFT_1211495 [Mycena rosella]|uniref:CxC2-like cysteine cluster KDZ transposase-associated domain-containing protein n=1 Tax=Mycena rosella TaxID=1033263 RepID=A0AAD7CUB5_MYCRO|nr:hypothetical protein B0H17DRAFT_1211495 [Mycena rosella]